MDTVTEARFLDCIKRSKVAINKSATKEVKYLKKQAWVQIVDELNKDEITWNKKQLSKRWYNIQGRVMEKLRKRKCTGGDSQISFSSNDNKVLDIIGENNPKVCM